MALPTIGTPIPSLNFPVCRAVKPRSQVLQEVPFFSISRRYVSSQVKEHKRTEKRTFVTGFCMYGWLVLLVALLVSCCCLDSATGSILKVFGREEDVLRSTTTHVCTEDDTTRTVSCRPSREGSGISMCCSLSWSTSAQFRPTPPCTPRSPNTTNHNATRHSTPTNCTLSIPASSSSSNNRRKRSLVAYELLTCVGSSLEVRCRVNLSCSDRGVAWRRAGEEYTLQGRDLRIQDVQGRDSGTYHCEVTDYFGKTRLGAVVVVVAQFEPTLTTPKPRWSRPLECTAEANPPATITWYKDDAPLLPLHHDDSPVWYIVSSETDECRTRSRLRLLPSSLEENATEAANFTCVAANRHGQAAATLLLPVSADEPSGALPADFKRRFNVTGFIVGMLPPLFISFYIIVKLGYRSRYAEERGEDDGFREEPFFISY